MTDFYDSHARDFFDATVNVDMSTVYAEFLPHLDPGALILDAGCGSGRDAIYFKKQGFLVEAFDASAELVKLATQHTGLAVKQMRFLELDEVSKFDAIWACSSILHLDKKQLKVVFKLFHDALKSGGIFFTSFKHGTFEGTKNGRHFTHFTPDGFEAFNNSLKLFNIVKSWVANDVRPEKKSDQWINIVLRACP